MNQNTIFDYSNISLISEYLKQHSSIINSDTIYETYVIQVTQPNNYILRLPSLSPKPTFEAFINDLNEFDMSECLIRIKNQNGKAVSIHNSNFSIDINNLLNIHPNASDIIFIFYFDSSGSIPRSEFEKIKPPQYYKRYYIIHVSRIKELIELINPAPEPSDDLKQRIEELESKNLSLCQQMDDLKLSSAENLKYNNTEYLKLQLDYEKLETDQQHLKSKLKNLKSKLKDYSRINKELNEYNIKLQKENKRLQADNDEFYMSIVC